LPSFIPHRFSEVTDVEIALRTFVIEETCDHFEEVILTLLDDLIR
jgi:hypothetical protein